METNFNVCDIVYFPAEEEFYIVTGIWVDKHIVRVLNDPDNMDVETMVDLDRESVINLGQAGDIFDQLKLKGVK